MHRGVLQRPEIGEQLMDVRLGHAIVQIGDEQLGGAATGRNAAAQRSAGTQQLLAALEHVMLPGAVHVSL